MKLCTLLILVVLAGCSHTPEFTLNDPGRECPLVFQADPSDPGLDIIQGCWNPQ